MNAEFRTPTQAKTRAVKVLREAIGNKAVGITQVLSKGVFKAH